jgi:hypothetical protein
VQGAGALIGCHARLAGHLASCHKPCLDLLEHSGAVLTLAAVTAGSSALPKLSLLLPLAWCTRSSLRPKPLPSLPLRPWQAALQGNMQELQMLRKQRDALDDQIQRLEWQLSKTAEGGRSHIPNQGGRRMKDCAAALCLLCLALGALLLSVSPWTACCVCR